jgi:DNA-binding CsgD family transcriptional regulator
MFVVTARQRQILELWILGLSDKEAAARLGISVATLRGHVQRLYEANDIRGRSRVVARFIVECALASSSSGEIYIASGGQLRTL